MQRGHNFPSICTNGACYRQFLYYTPQFQCTHNEASARGNDTGEIDNTGLSPLRHPVSSCLFSLCHFRVLMFHYGSIPTSPTACPIESNLTHLKDHMKSHITSRVVSAVVVRTRANSLPSTHSILPSQRFRHFR